MKWSKEAHREFLRKCRNSTFKEVREYAAKHKAEARKYHEMWYDAYLDDDANRLEEIERLENEEWEYVEMAQYAIAFWK